MFGKLKLELSRSLCNQDDKSGQPSNKHRHRPHWNSGNDSLRKQGYVSYYSHIITYEIIFILICSTKASLKNWKQTSNVVERLNSVSSRLLDVLFLLFGSEKLLLCPCK